MKYLGLMGLLTLLLLANAAFAADPILAEKATVPPGPDPVKLVGKWLRTDGGYILQLSEPRPDGSLKAEYFNPRPINVSASAWKHEGGYLGAFVELRAPNYPGSTYTLAYDTNKDHLVGIYFHAGLQQQFQVEFERTP